MTGSLTLEDTQVLTGAESAGQNPFVEVVYSSYFFPKAVLKLRHSPSISSS